MSDCPDYTHAVVLTSASNPIVDCPDWQEQVVAPGGGPVGSGALSYAYTFSTTYDSPLPGNGTPYLFVGGLAAGNYGFWCSVMLEVSSASGAGGIGLFIYASLDLINAPDQDYWSPGVPVTNAWVMLKLSGVLTITSSHPNFAMYAAQQGDITGTVKYQNATGAPRATGYTLWTV